jgi:hypothetical protein
VSTGAVRLMTTRFLDNCMTTGSGADEPACKPDPVPTSLAGAWVATIHLGPPSPTGSSGLPAGLGRAALGRPARPVLADRPS